METTETQDLLSQKSMERTLDKTVDGLGSFLGKICMPVADELGLYFQDKVRFWRYNNINEVLKRAEERLNESGGIKGRSVHPLLAWKILENGSFADTEYLQDYWAGLLASSCTDGQDDSNRMFVDILSQLTTLQVKVIEFSCLNSEKEHTRQGFLISKNLIRYRNEVQEICGTNDIHRIDRELDKLSSMGLISGAGQYGGFDPDADIAHLKPTPLCLHLYAKCKGCQGSLEEFYGVVRS